MNEETIYSVVLIICGVFYGISAYSINCIDETRLPGWEKLTREKIGGTVLGFAALIWCARHGTQVFPASAIRFYFYPAAFVFGWASYFLLDFLSARAIGGLLILTAHYLLHQSFSFHSPFRFILSAVCYLTGSAGIFLCWKPCLLRDLFRLAASDKSRKKNFVVVFASLSFVHLFYGISHLLGRV